MKISRINSKANSYWKSAKASEHKLILNKTKSSRYLLILTKIFCHCMALTGRATHQQAAARAHEITQGRDSVPCDAKLSVLAFRIGNYHGRDARIYLPSAHLRH